MDEQNPPGDGASEIPSVTGNVMSEPSVPAAPAAAAAPIVEPTGQPDAQGALRPVWPVKRPGQGARQARRYALIGKILASLCAALFFYVSWAPLATAITSGDLNKAATGPIYRFGLTAGELGAPPLHTMFGDGFFGVWSALTVAGLLITPFLWQTTFRWLRWVAMALATLWLVAMCVIFIQLAQLIVVDLPTRLHGGAGPYITTLYPYTMRVGIYSIAASYGLWLALLAALLGLAAATLAVVSAVTYQRARVPVAPSVLGEIVTPDDGRPARSLPGSGAITGGLLLWAWGFFLLPWATLNCAKTPLLVGSCQGLPVTSALQIGLGNARAYFDPSAGLYAITGLLLTGAVVILLAVWRRDITRTLCAWGSLWLALAFVSAGLAVVGAQQVVADAPAVGMPRGDWRGDMGVLIVFIALVLVSIGLIPLWAVAIRANQRRQAARRAQGA